MQIQLVYDCFGGGWLQKSSITFLCRFLILGVFETGNGVCFFGYVAFNQFWYTPFLRALQDANLSGMCCLSVCFGETDRVSFKLVGIATWNSTLVRFPRREARIVDGPQESVTNSGMAHATSEKNG